MQADETLAAPLRFVYCCLHIPITGPSALYPKLQKAIRETRTDLDSFSDAEIQLLVHQGFSAAQASWEPCSSQEPGTRSAPDTDIYKESADDVGWAPSKALSASTIDRLGKYPETIDRHKPSVRVFAEILSPLNWATALAVIFGSLTFYPSLERVVSWWTTRPRALGHADFRVALKSSKSNFLIELRKKQPMLDRLWNGIRSDNTGDQSDKDVTLVALQSGAEGDDKRARCEGGRNTSQCF